MCSIAYWNANEGRAFLNERLATPCYIFAVFCIIVIIYFAKLPSAKCIFPLAELPRNRRGTIRSLRTPCGLLLRQIRYDSFVKKRSFVPRTRERQTEDTSKSKRKTRKLREMRLRSNSGVNFSATDHAERNHHP